MQDTKICVLYGGDGSEREVSLRSGRAVYDTLIANGYKNIHLFDLSSRNINELPSMNPEVCFIALHGRYGEDGVIQGYLEMMAIPYTGSGVGASVVAFDKHLSKLCFEDNDIP
jgi:D-alanine-D-alanine ligase